MGHRASTENYERERLNAVARKWRHATQGSLLRNLEKRSATGLSDVPVLEVFIHLYLLALASWRRGIPTSDGTGLDQIIRDGTRLQGLTPKFSFTASACPR
jgi:hypothetical protein